jgi:hypothetical protein
MTTSKYHEQLKQEFMEQAQAIFEEIMADQENGEGITLREIKEKVNSLRFDLTRKLVESKLKVTVRKQQEPAE